MEKMAQKRQIGFLDRLREDTDVPGKLTEKFSPEFASLMEKLRTVDEEVRELAVSDINGGTLKSLLKVAKSNFNRREYVNTVIYLGKFHEKLQEIKDKFGLLQRDLTKAHNEFLFGDLDPEQKEFLMNKMPGKFKPKEKEKKASYADLMIKEAGVSDIWHNMTTERGKALKAWEKRFPQFAKSLKKETEKMINRSEVMFQTLASTLKSLASLRANRKLEEYVKNADAFTKKYDQYDDLFNTYYNTHVSRLIETQKGIDDEAASKIEDAIPSETIENSEEKEKPADVLSPAPESTSPKTDNVPYVSQPEHSPNTDKMPPVSPPSSGGGGEPADFPTPPSYTGVHPDIAAKMKELEEQMGNETSVPSDKSALMSLKGPRTHVPPTDDNFTPPSSALKGPRTHVPSTNNDFSAPVVDSSYDTQGEPVFQLQKAPHTQKVPSMPYLSTEAPPAPSRSGMTLKNPSIDFYNPSIPKAPLVPKEFKDLPSINGPDTEIDSPRTQKSAEQFIAELTAVADGSPIVMANKILKFANSIASTDKSTSDKLLAIARTILSRV